MTEDQMFSSKVLIAECQPFRAIKIGAIKLEDSNDLPPGVESSCPDSKPFTSSLSLFNQDKINYFICSHNETEHVKGLIVIVSNDKMYN